MCESQKKFLVTVYYIIPFVVCFQVGRLNTTELVPCKNMYSYCAINKNWKFTVHLLGVIVASRPPSRYALTWW